MQRDEIHFGTPTTDNVNSYLLLHTPFNVLVITFDVCTTLSLAFLLFDYDHLFECCVPNQSQPEPKRYEVVREMERMQ